MKPIEAHINHSLAFGLLLLRGVEIDLRNIGVTLHEESPGGVNPLLSIIYIHSARYAHVEVVDTCIHYGKLPLSQINAIHYFLGDAQTLTDLPRSIRQVLQLLALDISH